MSDVENIAYPTLGEVVRFAFNATGVLAEKHDHTPGFDEQQRKNLQKLLDRLACEEGNLSENLSEAYRQLAYLVTGYVLDPFLNFATGALLADLLDIYSQVIREEGTYLSKKDTLRWMIAERWAPGLAISVARCFLQCGLRRHQNDFPGDEDWYLPDLSGAEPVWPLAKVMQWIYTQAGVSQTQFHYPGRKADEQDHARQRDLENAQNWIKGRHFPSASALDWTFRRAFDTWFSNISSTPPASYSSPAVSFERMRPALFFARCMTAFAAELYKQFGKEYLQRICDIFGSTLAMAMQDAADAETWVIQVTENADIAYEIDIRKQVSAHWKENLGMRARQALAGLQKLVESNALNDEEVDQLVHAYGRLPVLPAVAMLRAPVQIQIPPGFANSLMDGLALAERRHLEDKQIDAYEASLELAGMSKTLGWIVPWLRFQIAYRNNDDTRAWAWIEQAFEAARYRAGERQYEIVNHYIEMAAKLGKRVPFRKGVHWARYIGHEVRWLRDREPTQENLDMVMNMMKAARYPV